MSSPASNVQRFWQKEDWWSVLIGCAIVLAAYIVYAGGSSLRWIAVIPPRWSSPAELGVHFLSRWDQYLAQFGLWVVPSAIALWACGYSARRFVPGFFALYLLAMIVFTIGQWTEASRYFLEPPLVALVLGFLIANTTGSPVFLQPALRVELFVKIGIVLLGATLPFTILVWAGPIAMLQASIVSLVTFFVIFLTARSLGLDPRLGATLGAGGAVCGVSASIAVAGAVGAKKEDVSISIALVSVWAIIMVFVLPTVSRFLDLPAGIAGAWIGTSEFADAAGLAAAQSYGAIAERAGAEGATDQAVWSFTLVKVLGRDIWIGIWSLVLALVAISRWENTGIRRQVNVAQVWQKFPKFVVGFIVCSLFVTWVASGMDATAYNKLIAPKLVGPIKDLRTWAFILCFLSIGLSTRFRDFTATGRGPAIAFTVGVLVNVVLGYLLSAIVFADHWVSFTK